jgi:signal transduction histidine kinase
MTSLYWRIFLSFWLALALILVGTVSVVVNGEQQRRFSRAWTQRAEIYAQATQTFESGGANALRDWLKGMHRADNSAPIFITDSSGQEMLGRSIPDYLREPPERLAASHDALLHPTLKGIGGPLVLVGPDARTYHVIVGPLRAGPHLFGELEMPAVSTATLLIALVVSAVVCFFLARYLVLPVDQLRRATRQIASGDLDVRVSPKLKGRHDELGLLASDLDTMSERVRNLLELKQQLLRDVSHELRSPLARLQLALSLARREGASHATPGQSREGCPGPTMSRRTPAQEGATHASHGLAREGNPGPTMSGRTPAQEEGSGVERHLARIGCEADRLEELIARTLKLARLERPMQGVERTLVDVAELLTNIVADVGIEADAHGCSVALETARPLEVNGDPELLRSAMENVIRNAVRYAPAGSKVGIEARRADGRHIEVIVWDHGPGVPEKDLELIFEPFYRVDAARNRAVGGDGLGLAIAARAVAIHGGTIQARNLGAGGLAVQLSLPALDATPAARLEHGAAA